MLRYYWEKILDYFERKRLFIKDITGSSEKPEFQHNILILDDGVQKWGVVIAPCKIRNFAELFFHQKNRIVACSCTEPKFQKRTVIFSFTLDRWQRKGKELEVLYCPVCDFDPPQSAFFIQYKEQVYMV